VSTASAPSPTAAPGPLARLAAALRAAPVAGALLALAAALGLALRWVGAGNLVLFGDEVHSLSWALGRHADWLAPYAPLGRWNRLLLDTVGLEEWGLRAPALLAGSLAVVLMCALALRAVARPGADARDLLGWGAAAGFTALAPYEVYQAREARVYALVLLLSMLCGLGVLDWLARCRRASLLAAAAAAALVVYLHTAMAATVAGCFAVAGVGALVRGDRRRRAVDLGLAAAGFAAAVAALVGADLGAVGANIGARTGAGEADARTLLEALRLGLSLPAPGAAGAGALGALAAGFGLVGSVSLARRHPWPTAIVATAFALQLAALYTLQPTMLSVPWVLLRYIAHGLPWLTRRRRGRGQRAPRRARRARRTGCARRAPGRARTRLHAGGRLRDLARATGPLRSLGRPRAGGTPDPAAERRRRAGRGGRCHRSRLLPRRAPPPRAGRPRRGAPGDDLPAV